jgi:membrane-associated phospholipid phosphatase
VSVLVAAGQRFLPRGWGDLGRQLAIWFGFLAAYQGARGIADRNPPKAFDNALQVIGIERHANALFELTLQRIVDGSQLLATLVSWTYWNSEFTVVGLALLFVYLRRNDAFVRFRNAILLATAPPRMFPDLGFADTLADFGGLNHGSGLVELASNPYAAMPSLHAADALIVGLVLFSVCRNRFIRAAWLLWPAWVWFAVMGTGNHFWLDVAAGVVVAVIALVIVYRPGWFRLRRRRPSAAPA